jgi:hypothetical protein
MLRGPASITQGRIESVKSVQLLLDFAPTNIPQYLRLGNELREKVGKPEYARLKQELLEVAAVRGYDCKGSRGERYARWAPAFLYGLCFATGGS